MEQENLKADQAQPTRQGEELSLENLQNYLTEALALPKTAVEILQFPSGYSNLTYLLKLGEKELVLRRPPFGAENIAKGHDMGREYKVLSLLYPIYPKVPQPLLYCQDKNIIGAEFYVMERVQGVILRAGQKLEMLPEKVRQMHQNCIQNLVQLHQIDIFQTQLHTLGKPEGYLQRQIEGWCKRYQNAQTEHIEAMQTVMQWLNEHLPQEEIYSFIHNDYKFDNLVLNPNDLTEIKAVLDWEMATIGNPYTDLGIMLSYMPEKNDPVSIQNFNIQLVDGLLDRGEILAYYEQLTGKKITHIVFYYAFAMFKLGVIVQQIYYRYHKGYTQDKRFANLIYMVKDCATMAQKAILQNTITNFA